MDDETSVEPWIQRVKSDNKNKALARVDLWLWQFKELIFLFFGGGGYSTPHLAAKTGNVRLPLQGLLLLNEKKVRAQVRQQEGILQACFRIALQMSTVTLTARRVGPGSLSCLRNSRVIGYVFAVNYQKIQNCTRKGDVEFQYVHTFVYLGIPDVLHAER